MIEIFGKSNCPECKRALGVVRQHNAIYEYKNVEYKRYLNELSEKLEKVPTRVPYIFMDGSEIRTVDELERMLKFAN